MELLLYLHLSIIVMSIAISGFESTDQLALQDLKSRITDDPLHVMASWNDHSSHFCNWTGVTCSPYNDRVINLDLSSRKLVGTIPSSIGNLSFLTGIHLENNSFHGEIPQAIGLLLQLEHLNLTSNSFSGKIPTNLTYCKELRVLDLRANDLVGKIVDQLSSLSKLNFFRLKSNSFTGGIPYWIGNFSSLKYLDISSNSLQGPIPQDLGRLVSLEVFKVYENELSANIGLTLPNLEVFAGAVNSFTGCIPVSLANASRLHVNRLGGRGSSEGLKFLDFLTNCTNMIVLSFAANYFNGELPNSIANLSTVLEILTLGDNRIHGTLPAGVGSLIKLTLLGMENNCLNDSVPETIGRLNGLEGLYLSGNAFSGTIPISIGNLTKLISLYLQENRLEGIIPPELGKCNILSVLNLTKNHLVGSIPEEVAGLSSLSISLSLASNSFTGPLPKELGQLINLEELDVSQNKLSGEIPSTLSNCLGLERINISSNLFQGTIPQSLTDLRSLGEIDFSRNNLSGEIPEFLGKLPYLQKLDLSFNELEGKVPNEGIFANTSAFSINGNNRLCGGVPNLHLPECSKATKHLDSGVLLAVIVTLALSVLVLCSCAAYYKLSNSRKAQPWNAEQLFEIPRTTYRAIHRATNGFSDANLVGRGSFGSVYKAHFDVDNTIMAVKVLNLQQRGALRSFLDECRTLSTIRHRNLLKIKIACSSIDHQGNDFKCIVFGFMTNGNLHDCSNSRSPQSPAALKGSIGYIPIEYGSGGQASTFGDVYSFGIVLLELFISRRPTDAMFNESLNIHKYVSMALPAHVMDIVDPILLLTEEEQNINQDQARTMEECLLSVLEIGLTCSASSPRDRMPIITALSKLQSIKKSFLSRRL
ncbi:hypothetical protein H5410_053441 [Solanum commersonii]|uniref:non-specific serine/threonine protein kinase n=1 Tax=Solanum commersonii TaxID=4109 RepID=A0A9J5X6E5_SOLCO|nr:hypothetical protein H5410_053441 [Solanum commersonii]